MIKESKEKEEQADIYKDKTKEDEEGKVAPSLTNSKGEKTKTFTPKLTETDKDEKRFKPALEQPKESEARYKPTLDSKVKVKERNFNPTLEKLEKKESAFKPTLNFKEKNEIIMVCGLQGSGKTTTVVKLAH